MDASVNRIPTSKDERALLISIRLPGCNKKEEDSSLKELKLLVKTAGGITAKSITVNREKLDAAYIVGKGYLEKLKILLEEKKIYLIVFDLNNIRPAQIRNLEEHLKCRVIGRTEVILDIFARRAKSAESKIEVEIAQLNYILPRLKGYGGVLSRLGGGIGTRGPGEKMLETDRRHIQKRISKLKKDLGKYEKHRKTTRKHRKNIIKCSVVGYTNAGKSTLINALAKDDLFVENRLFATLDSYTRKVYVGNQKNILMTDTVGFIKNLPTGLIASFRSTLEEIEFSDIILIVADMTSPNVEEQLKTVYNEIDNYRKNQNTILFLNKCDNTNQDQIAIYKNTYPHAVIGSAASKINLDALIESINILLKTIENTPYSS